MELQRVIDEFIIYNQAEKAVSPLTVSALKSDLRGFLRHWQRLNLPNDIQACSTRTIRQCMAAMYQEHGYKASTMNRKIDTLRSLFRFAVEQGYIAHNPMDKIRAPKPDQVLPVYLREDELQLLLALPERKKRKNWLRDKAILYLLAYTGLRRAELLNLKWEDIRFDQGSIRVMGKGRKERMIPMNKALSDVLWDYLQSQLPVSANSPLFRNQFGKPLNGSNLHDLFKRYVRAAGLDPTRISLHKMRHTFATMLLARGTDLVTIQQLLGHTEISSTQIYAHTTVARSKSAVDSLMLPRPAHEGPTGGGHVRSRS